MESGVDPIELADLSDQARRYLRWSVALLLFGLGILMLDLWLKRIIAEQAADASQTWAKVKGHGRSPSDVATAPDDGGVAGGSGGDAVDGSPGMATGDDQARSPRQARKRGVEQRPGGDAPGD